jgi:HlyD family secretion protein
MAALLRRLRLVLPMLLLTGAAFWLLRPAPVPVDVAVVTRGPLEVTVDEEGETRVRNRFVVAAPVTGRIERIRLDPGDPVEAGTIVAQVHPTPLDPRSVAEAEARLAAAAATESEAQARVGQAKAALEQARRDAVRARSLLSRKAISKEELERSELAEESREKDLEAAEFAARAARYEVVAARATLLAAGAATDRGSADTVAEAIHVRSPVQGRVLRVHEESERIVAAGTPLVEVGDESDLEVVVDVLSKEAVRIQPGMDVRVEDWGGEPPLAARVRLVEPSGFTKVSALGVEEQRVNVIVDFVTPPPSLGDAYRVEARIVVWRSDAVMQVPASALFREREKWHVFAVEAGRARTREIGVGQRGSLNVEVTSGLAAGDIVILHPSDRITDGVRVETVKAG